MPVRRDVAGGATVICRSTVGWRNGPKPRGNDGDRREIAGTMSGIDFLPSPSAIDP